MPKLEIYLITLCMHFLWGQTTVSVIINWAEIETGGESDDTTIRVTCRDSIPIVEHANARGLSTFVCVTTSTVSPASLTALHSLVSIASESITIINRVLRRRIYFPSDNLFTSGTSIPVSFSMRHFAADRRCDVSAEKGTVKMVAHSDFSSRIYLVQRANLVLSKGPY